MRVISGIYKRRRWDIPRTFKARPTTDFAKENLFNVLSNLYDLEDEVDVLDLFAGTGSISLELLSRGCRQVISIERDRDHFRFISQIQKELKDERWLPIRADVFSFISKCHSQFDLIFADPPYELPNLSELPDLVLQHNLLKADGLFILEHGKTNHFEDHPNFREMRTYGSVHFSFFQQTPG